VVALGAGAWEDPATRAAVWASGFAALWLAGVPERAWTRVGGDPCRPLAATRQAFLARWARRTAAWSEAPMVLPLGRPVRALAELLVKSADC
jgi:shikimate kinase